MKPSAFDRVRPTLNKAASLLKLRLMGLAIRVTGDEYKSRRFFSEAKLMAHFSAITMAATAIEWIIYYILILCGAQANIAFTVCYIIGVGLIFLFKVMHARRHSEIDSIAARFFKFAAVYVVSLAVGNFIVYIAASFLHDGWALWFSYPFTFTINSLGNRFYVFKDADDRAAKKTPINKD